MCVFPLFSFILNRTYCFCASFAIFRRKALQPLTQSIACAIAKLCIRHRKALHPPTQSIAQFDVQISATTPAEPKVAGWKERQREGKGKAKGQRGGKGQKHINNEGVSNCCDTPSLVFSLKDFNCIGLLTRSSLPCSCERMTCNGFVPFSWPQRRAPQPRQDMPS